MRRLFVDLSVIIASDAGTGIQRVVRGIWTHLVSLELNGVEVVPVCATRQSGYRVATLRGLPQSRTSLAGGDRVAPREGDIFLGLDLAAHVLPRHEMQVAEWKRAGATVHIVVYDLLPYNAKRFFRWRTRRNFARWLRLIARHADGAICISHAVGHDMANWLRKHAGVRRDIVQVQTIRLGHDIMGSEPSRGMPADAEDILAWMNLAPTILMVGTVEPRKGYDVALAAFENLWRASAPRPFQLAIIGRPGWKTARLQARLRDLDQTCDYFRWLEDVSDEFLERLYGSARGLLFCSFAEGFGLPLVEASAAGLPVLARDLRVYRELPLSPAYFNDDSPASLAATIRTTFTPAEARQALSSSLPNWEEAARELLGRLGLASASRCAMHDNVPPDSSIR